MITFLIPVKPFRYTSDLSVLMSLLTDAVSSCLAVPRSKILIACDRKSAAHIRFMVSQRVTLLIDPDDTRPYGDGDKGEKLRLGCLHWLHECSPTADDHIMPLDCDDLVRKDINDATYAGRNTVFSRGYLKIWNRLYLQKMFWYRNGSSHILSRAYVREALDAEDKNRFLYHLDIRRDECDFVFLDEPFVIQRIWHGENVYYAKEGTSRGVGGYSEANLFNKLLKYALFSTGCDRRQFVF